MLFQFEYTVTASTIATSVVKRYIPASLCSMELHFNRRSFILSSCTTKYQDLNASSLGLKRHTIVSLNDNLWLSNRQFISLVYLRYSLPPWIHAQRSCPFHALISSIERNDVDAGFASGKSGTNLFVSALPVHLTYTFCY